MKNFLLFYLNRFFLLVCLISIPIVKTDTNLTTKDKISALSALNALQEISLLQDPLTIAIGNKYQCDEGARLSVLNRAIQLTASTIVNKQTIELSNQIGHQVRTFTNQYRASKNLPPLAWDQYLAFVGRGHTIQMANGVKPFDHDGFFRRFDRYKERRDAIRFGENLFFGKFPANQVARVAVNLWIQSPGHEANLRGAYNRIGVSAFKNSDGVWYITQLFAFVRP